MGQALLCAFLGEGSDGGYAEVIPAAALTRPMLSDPNGTQTIKHALMNRRYAYFNELRFDGRVGCRYFNDGELKELCEQMGTKIKTRTLYCEPETWRPMCGVYGTGNPPLPLSVEQCRDTGTRRRLVHSKMPRTFTLQEDKDLKAPAMQGYGNSELFHMTKLLYGYITTQGKRVEPCPPRMVRETAELLNCDVVASIQHWMEVNTISVVDYQEATTQMVLRRRLEADVIQSAGNASALARAGLQAERRTHARYYTYLFEGAAQPTPVRLREAEVEP
jgi:hypothetical protein